jgi:hypothetical protein
MAAKGKQSDFYNKGIFELETRYDKVLRKFNLKNSDVQ